MTKTVRPIAGALPVAQHQDEETLTRAQLEARLAALKEAANKFTAADAAKAEVEGTVRSLTAVGKTFENDWKRAILLAKKNKLEYPATVWVQTKTRTATDYLSLELLEVKEAPMLTEILYQDESEPEFEFLAILGIVGDCTDGRKNVVLVF